MEHSTNPIAPEQLTKLTFSYFGHKPALIGSKRKQ
jgi:hypothetical protein